MVLEKNEVNDPFTKPNRQCIIVQPKIFSCRN
jgi:hypothetical protein